MGEAQYEARNNGHGEHEKETPGLITEAGKSCNAPASERFLDLTRDFRPSITRFAVLFVYVCAEHVGDGSHFEHFLSHRSVHRTAAMLAS